MWLKRSARYTKNCVRDTFMNNTVPLTAQQAYEEWHSKYGVDKNVDAPWHQMVKQQLSSYDLLDKTVLEIGCGRGGLSCWLAQRAQRPRQIVAADFSRTAVEKGAEYARTLGLSGITWEVGDIQDIKRPDESFDTVFSCETIEHVPDPNRALSELSRVLRPGGRLFLTTPNYLGMMGLYRIYSVLRGRGFTEEGQPINNCLLLPATRSWVERAGLRVVQVRSVGHYLPFPGRPPIDMPFFNHGGILTKWFGYHSLIVADKLVSKKK